MSEQTTSTDWLQTVVCDPYRGTLGGLMHHPWLIKWCGGNYHVATNGMWLVLLDRIGPIYPEPSERQRDALCKHLDRTGTLIGATDVPSPRPVVRTAGGANLRCLYILHGYGTDRLSLLRQGKG